MATHPGDRVELVATKVPTPSCAWTDTPDWVAIDTHAEQPRRQD